MKVENVGTQPANKNWDGLFTSNRAVENGLLLSYITPEVQEVKVVIQLDKSEVDHAEMEMCLDSLCNWGASWV